MPPQYIPDMPAEFRPGPWERDHLLATELADFLKRDVHDVRRILGIKGNSPIGKTWLWTLILGGAERASGRLAEIEARVERANRRRTTPVAKSVKRAVVDRDQSLCRYCGRLLPRDEIHLDHVIPKSQGGDRLISNIVVSCSPCNTRKGRRLPHEVGMRILPIGQRRRGRTNKRSRPIPAPPETYETLVMGDFIIVEIKNCEDS